MKQNTGALKKFVTKECANYYEGGCVYGKACLVTRGNRCGYFERAVLHKPDYPYPHKCFIEDPEFEQAVRYDYRLIGGGTESVRIKARRCECGAPLMKRQRLCAKCSGRKRRESNKRRQADFRKKSRSLTVTI